jgi:O-antigen ligase
LWNPGAYQRVGRRRNQSLKEREERLVENGFIGFLPVFIMQVIYAIFVAQIAKRTKKPVVVYVIFTLVPFVGAFFFIYVMWTTILRMLDSINELTAAQMGNQPR